MRASSNPSTTTPRRSRWLWIAIGVVVVAVIGVIAYMAVYNGGGGGTGGGGYFILAFPATRFVAFGTESSRALGPCRREPTRGSGRDLPRDLPLPMVAAATIGSKPQQEDPIAIPTDPVGIAPRDMPVGQRQVPIASGS